MYQKIDFEKIQPGDLVQVPRTCIASRARSWNGWIFAQAIVVKKLKAPKETLNDAVMIDVMIPKACSNNGYDTTRMIFPACTVFKSNRAKIAQKVLDENQIRTKKQFDIAMTTWTGADWIRFIYDNGFIELED